MTNGKEGERIAVLENEADNHGTQIEKLTGAVNEMSHQLHSIALQLAGNKGFIAGMSVTLAGIGSVIGAVFTLIADHFLGHR